MITKNEIINIAFLSTYPPRECGLATFTEDLINEIDKIGTVRASVIAVTNGEVYDDPRVECKISQHQRANYFRTALWVNNHMDLLVIEHEYGIFGVKNPFHKKEMENKTLTLGQTMAWSNVAERYTQLFINVAEKIQRTEGLVG